MHVHVHHIQPSPRFPSTLTLQARRLPTCSTCRPAGPARSRSKLAAAWPQAAAVRGRLLPLSRSRVPGLLLGRPSQQAMAAVAAVAPPPWSCAPTWPTLTMGGLPG